MSNAHLNWAILLIAIAMVLFFLEFFVPSGGILTVAALICLAVGVFFLYKVDTTVGMIGAIVSIAALPFVMALGLKLLPSTPFYRRLLLKTQQQPGLGAFGIAGAAGKDRFKAMIGTRGEAVTDLRPVGKCIINGEREDCYAESGTIEAGSRIRVIAADAMQIKVKKEE